MSKLRKLLNNQTDTTTDTIAWVVLGLMGIGVIYSNFFRPDDEPFVGPKLKAQHEYTYLCDKPEIKGMPESIELQLQYECERGLPGEIRMALESRVMRDYIQGIGHTPEYIFARTLHDIAKGDDIITYDEWNTWRKQNL